MHRLFFFNDTATTEIYTLSLHDALPISSSVTPVPGNNPLLGINEYYSLADDLRFTKGRHSFSTGVWVQRVHENSYGAADRKSTRLNSSHSQISYAVFCLKKKKQQSTAHD